MIPAKGFTLIEVLVSMLILGLTAASLLQLLMFGGKQYDELARGWKQRETVSALRLACREAVLTGNAAALTPAFAENILRRAGNRLRMSGFSLRACAPRAWFVQARLFDDVNLNGREDRGETVPLTTWCFCERGDPS